MKTIVALVLLIVLAAPADAKDSNREPSAQATSNRKKSIDFEEDVIEGMNKNPLDSLQSVGKMDSQTKSHLYKKRGSFKKEMKQTVNEVGYMP